MHRSVLLLVFLLGTPVVASAQDLDLSFSFPEASAVEVDSALLATPNVVQAYELDMDGDGWTERLLLSFTPREEGTHHASLNNFLAHTHDLFSQRLPERIIRAIPLDLPTNPLADADLPFAAFGFFRPDAEGLSCDSAALFFESEAGFWTLSWNAPFGWLRGDLAGVFGLIETMQIGAAETTPEGPDLARVVPNAEPLAFDRSRLAVVR